MIEARYFFGGNVAGARVEWSLLQRDFFFNRYVGEGGYAFDDYDYFTFGRGPGFNEPVASGTGVIGPDGRLVIDVPVDIARRKNGASLILRPAAPSASMYSGRSWWVDVTVSRLCGSLAACTSVTP